MKKLIKWAIIIIPIVRKLMRLRREMRHSGAR